MALALFAITLFVSAFILFLVQPIIGKTILPKLGGTPQVWNTCMVFFQTVLLLGYFYTHAATTKLSQRAQLILHGILLFIPFVLFAIIGIFDVTNWIPPPGANPIWSTLLLLLLVVGIPFFVVSTSAPLLQKWFGSTGHPAAKDPYFLYAASNLGSLLVLFPLYPVVIEPFMDLTPQKKMWAVGYGILVVLVLGCIALIWKPSGEKRLRPAGPMPPVEPASEGQPVPPPVEGTTTPSSTAVTATPPAPMPAAPKSTAFKKGKPHHGRHQAKPAFEPLSIQTRSDEITMWRRLRWIGLAFVPSSLMLGVTTHITTDLSPIPLFWLIPLCIYILSFILVFSKWPVVWVEKPHTILLYLQPVLICLMVFMEIVGPYIPGGNAAMFVPIFFDVLAFTATALVCHGEMAKDRPSTKHLTEFYLLMSVGGMLGGIFNGIIAPVVFKYVVEFGVAVVCACLLRPQMRDRGWAEELLSGVMDQPGSPGHGHKGPPQTAGVGFGDSTTIAADVILPVGALVIMVVLQMVAGGMPTGGDSEGVPGLKLFTIFGIPLIIAALFYSRPLRFGIAIAGILIYHSVLVNRGDSSLYADRSYFGVLRVKFGQEGKTNANVRFTQLIHGHINHGMNIFRPDDKSQWGNPEKDFSRLPTTYYHTYGPVGIVMRKFNWFDDDWLHGKPNTYSADARMPVSLIGQTVASLGIGNLPMAPMVDLWSEPPFATIGLGTGTMACYGRPFQHVHFYEIDNFVRKMSLPLGKDEYYFTKATLPKERPFTYDEYADPKNRSSLRTYFNCLKEAVNRGCELQIYMGDARLRMDLPYGNFHAKGEKDIPLQFGKVPPGGPENFYHMMVVDAFSSDAIPVHLITKEAILMYFKHLTEDGVLCVHTSNRYVNLPLVVAAVADELGYSYQIGHDNTPASGDEAKKKGLQPPVKELGRFTAEWVMVAKKADYLKHLTDPPDYAEELKKIDVVPGDKRWTYWTTTTSTSKYLWTDDHSNLWNVLK